MPNLQTLQRASSRNLTHQRYLSQAENGITSAQQLRAIFKRDNASKSLYFGGHELDSSRSTVAWEGLISNRASS